MLMMKIQVMAATDGIFRRSATAKRIMIGGGWNLLRQNHSATGTTTSNTPSLINGTIGIVAKKCCYYQNLPNNKQQLYASQRHRTFVSSVDDSTKKSKNEGTVTSTNSFTGVVKLWDQSKRYGFITARIGALSKDIFVNGSSLSSSVKRKVSEVEVEADQEQVADANPSLDLNPSPILLKGEPVRFRIRTESNGLQKAVDITLIDGQPIPVLRDRYLSNVHNRAKMILGEKIYELLKNNTSNDKEALLKEIQSFYNEAAERIALAERKIVALGMKVEDFKVRTNRYDVDDE